MKPDWKDAPEWANYLAMDEDGYWCWYLRKPIAIFLMALLALTTKYLALST